MNFHWMLVPVKLATALGNLLIVLSEQLKHILFIVLWDNEKQQIFTF